MRPTSNELIELPDQSDRKSIVKKKEWKKKKKKKKKKRNEKESSFKQSTIGVRIPVKDSQLGHQSISIVEWAINYR